MHRTTAKEWLFMTGVLIGGPLAIAGLVYTFSVSPIIGFVAFMLLMSVLARFN